MPLHTLATLGARIDASSDSAQLPCRISRTLRSQRAFVSRFDRTASAENRVRYLPATGSVHGLFVVAHRCQIRSWCSSTAVHWMNPQGRENGRKPRSNGRLLRRELLPADTTLRMREDPPMALPTSGSMEASRLQAVLGSSQIPLPDGRAGTSGDVGAPAKQVNAAAAQAPGAASGEDEAQIFVALHQRMDLVQQVG